jgi:GrpB-like predicted nucleotidyltransferase (UPF0157 family)
VEGGYSRAMPASSHFPIELRAHDPSWAAIAARETARLRDALGEALVLVHHIGSTSIPGIRAKPIVDLLPLVTSLAEVDRHQLDVEALGYEWRGELGIAGRRYCVLVGPDDKRIAQLHIFAAGDETVARHLQFRDYLRAHADEAAAYEREKIRAAALHPHDVNAYNGEKSAWIRACEERAAAWWAASRPGA